MIAALKQLSKKTLQPATETAYKKKIKAFSQPQKGLTLHPGTETAIKKIVLAALLQPATETAVQKKCDSCALTASARNSESIARKPTEYMYEPCAILPEASGGPRRFQTMVLGFLGEGPKGLRRAVAGLP